MQTLAPIEYARIGQWRPKRSWWALWLGLDMASGVFLFSQLAFLLAMMNLNIHECFVPPYGGGSSYCSYALGDAEFVRAHPALAAWVAALPRGIFELAGGPAFLANLVTVTGISYVTAIYLLVRIFRTRRIWRVIMAVLAMLMIATLPFIYGAIVVRLD